MYAMSERGTQPGNYAYTSIVLNNRIKSIFIKIHQNCPVPVTHIHIDKFLAKKS